MNLVRTVLLLLIASVAWSQTVWTPETMIKFKRVGGVDISPNGKFVAYTVSSPMMEGEHSDYLTHIWVAATDGSFNVQFTQGDKSCTNPKFSADGNYLAFLSARTYDKMQVWAMRVTGGEAEQITRSKVGVEQFAWSPDGKRIAFTQRDADPDEERNKKEKRDWTIVDHWKYCHLYTVAWEKNFSTLHGKHLRDTRRLTRGDFHVTSFSWSPDSKKIAFTVQATPSVDSWPTSDISLIPADSGSVTTLVASKGMDFGPQWSPDGKQIAFVSDGGNPKWAGTSDAYTISASGGQPVKFCESPDRQCTLVGWAGDGKGVYIAEVDHTHGRLYFLPSSGPKPVVMTPGEGTYTNVVVSADNRTMAFVHQSPEQAPEIFVTSTAKFEPRQLSDCHHDFPKLPMGKTEVIHWVSRDGRNVEGLLTYPVQYEKGKQYPLILNLHGGPFGVFTQIFTGTASAYPIQAFAQQGYAVLRPNPRGSSGYGREFRHLNYNDWGFGDYDDDQAGVDKVISMGVAHPDSLVVCGWSYGGYMSAFTITRTHRFKAASAGAPVTDLVSFMGTSDVTGFVPDYFGGDYWDRLDTYIKHSPVFNLKNVTTPMQVIHGERDARVPTSQGYELYSSLKRLGVTCEMITYPRTMHSVQEPKFIEDIGERIISWFNRELRHCDRPGFLEHPGLEVRGHD